MCGRVMPTDPVQALTEAKEAQAALQVADQQARLLLVSGILLVTATSCNILQHCGVTRSALPSCTRLLTSNIDDCP